MVYLSAYVVRTLTPLLFQDLAPPFRLQILTYWADSVSENCTTGPPELRYRRKVAFRTDVRTSLGGWVTIFVAVGFLKD